MSSGAPIEDAYAAFVAEVGARLASVSFIADASHVEVDPNAPIEPEGDGTAFVAAAAVVKLKTVSPRQTMGSGAPRYVVERYLQVELAAIGPSQDGRLGALFAARGALAGIPVDKPTLDGMCERVILGSPLAEGDAPESFRPDGDADTLAFTLRVRSGDPLGMTPTS